MSVLNANMNVGAIDLSRDVIDLTREPIDLTEEGVQDIMDLFQQNQPEHEDLNGYISDDGFVVGPGEGESEVDEDEQHREEEEQPQPVLQPQQNDSDVNEGGNVTPSTTSA